MAKTAAQWREARAREENLFAREHAPEEKKQQQQQKQQRRRREWQQRQQLLRQKRKQAPAQPAQDTVQTQCPTKAQPAPRLPAQGHAQPNGQNGHASAEHEVKVRLRHLWIFLQPRDSTNTALLRADAAHFNDTINYWERLGRFETIRSVNRFFIAQYDKADVNESGTPRCVIGSTELFGPDSGEEGNSDVTGGEDAGKKEEEEKVKQEDGVEIKQEEGEKQEQQEEQQEEAEAEVEVKEEEEEEEGTLSQKSTIQPGTPEPVQCLGKRTRDSAPSLDCPREKKPRQQGFFRDDSDSEVDSDTDTDTDTDSDDDDEPPDWSEYANGPADDAAPDWMEYKDGNVPTEEPDEVLDTRVQFVQIDVIPPKVWEALYECENPLPKPRSYLIEGVEIPPWSS